MPIPIDFSKMSGPITAFINSISQYIGEERKPARMIKEAEAEITIEKMKAKAHPEIKLIEERSRINVEAVRQNLFDSTGNRTPLSSIEQAGVNRLIYEETRKQRNLNDIVVDALPHLSDTATPNDVEQDWYAFFFDKAKLVSDESVQAVWGKILAGEANSPSTYSRSLIHTLSLMSKKDAESFQLVVRLSVEVAGYFIPIIFLDDSYHKSKGLTYEQIVKLADLGLLNIAHGTVGYQLTILSDDRKVPMKYHDHTIDLIAPKTEEVEVYLNAGHVKFSADGDNLSKLVESVPPLDDMIDHLSTLEEKFFNWRDWHTANH